MVKRRVSSGKEDGGVPQCALISGFKRRLLHALSASVNACASDKLVYLTYLSIIQMNSGGRGRPRRIPIDKYVAIPSAEDVSSGVTTIMYDGAIGFRSMPKTKGVLPLANTFDCL